MVTPPEISRPYNNSNPSRPNPNDTKSITPMNKSRSRTDLSGHTLAPAGLKTHHHSTSRGTARHLRHPLRSQITTRVLRTLIWKNTPITFLHDEKNSHINYYHGYFKILITLPWATSANHSVMKRKTTPICVKSKMLYRYISMNHNSHTYHTHEFMTYDLVFLSVYLT